MLFRLLPAQNLYILKFISGNFQQDNSHRVEIYNANDYPINISSYLLVTRDYAFIFPKNSFIPAKSKIALGKTSTYANPLNFSYEKYMSFLFKPRKTTQRGNYVILFNRQHKIIDAFYHSSKQNVTFLPDSGQYLDSKNKLGNYIVPSEKSKVWRFFPLNYDPALVFLHYGNEWKVASKTVNINPVIIYDNFFGIYQDKINKIKFSAKVTPYLREIVLERGNTTYNFNKISAIDFSKQDKTNIKRIIYDKDVKQNETYYYRLKAEDIFGYKTFSSVIKVQTIQPREEFTMDFYSEKINGELQYNVKIYTFLLQQVKIKILDSKYREVAILFNQNMNSNTFKMIKLKKKLQQGTYFIVAKTQFRRYFKKINLQKA